ADTIPMTPLADRELQALWERRERPATGRCFLYNGKPLKDFRKALHEDKEAAGIERTVTPYLLRHSFATIAWSIGVEKDVARRILRHTDLMMLEKVYCRPRPADLVARVAAFDLPNLVG
ncbi:MAG: tyrosine-type recombinase/integrase, partial [Myxococcota bacterium]